MFRQAALMMSPAKATAAARSSPTPSKKVVAALSAAIRSCSPKQNKKSAAAAVVSPKNSSKKKVTAAASSMSPKKVAFDAKIAAQTKAALSGMFSSTEKKSQKTAAAATISPKKKSATTKPAATPVSSPKKKSSLAKTKKASNCGEGCGEATNDDDVQVDDTLIDYDAAYDAMATIRAEIIFPIMDQEEKTCAAGVVPADKNADLAVELFAEEIGAGATETARALMDLAKTGVEAVDTATTPQDDAAEQTAQDFSAADAVVSTTPALDIPVADSAEIAPAATHIIPAVQSVVIPNQLPTQFTAGSSSAAKITCHDLNSKLMDIIFSSPTPAADVAPAAAAAALGDSDSQGVIHEKFPFSRSSE